MPSKKQIVNSQPSETNQTRAFLAGALKFTAVAAGGFVLLDLLFPDCESMNEVLLVAIIMIYALVGVNVGSFTRPSKQPVQVQHTQQAAELTSRSRPGKAAPAETELTPTSDHVDRLLAAADSGNFEEADRVMLDMQRQGVEPCSTSCLAMVRAGAKTGDLAVAERWMEPLLSSGDPSIVSIAVNHVINACVKCPDASKAEHWLRKLPGYGARPDIMTYNGVIHACAAMKEADKAQMLLYEARAQDFQPSPSSYIAVVKVLAGSGDPCRAAAWLTLMLDEGIRPQDECYNAVVCGYCDIGDASQAMIWLEAWKTNGGQPSASSYNAVALACAQAGNLDEAEFCVQALVDNGMECNLGLFNLLLQVCAGEQDAERATMFFDLMMQACLEPNIISFNTLICMYARLGDGRGVEYWMRRMEEAGIEPDSVTLDAVATAMA